MRVERDRTRIALVGRGDSAIGETGDIGVTGKTLAEVKNAYLSFVSLPVYEGSPTASVPEDVNWNVPSI